MVLLGRAKRVLLTEGLPVLMRRGLAFVMGRFFMCKVYYVTQNRPDRMRGLDEADFLPRIADLVLKVVSGNHEADRLEDDGFDFRSSAPDWRQRLDRGAMAFCVFVGRELGSIGWVAFSKEAQASLDEPPLPVDYESGEAYRGGVWTSPKYRGLGLHTYGNFKRCQFLVERGVPRWWGLIERGNTVSLRTNLKFAPVIESEGRYLRVLWWKSWKGRPLSPEMERELNAVRRAGGRRRQAEGRGAMAGTSRLSTG